MNLTELKNSVLSMEGYTGNTTQMYRQWLVSETIVVEDPAVSLNDLLVSYLDVQAVPEMQLNDRLKSWYISLGLGTADDHINELEYKYWQDRTP